jgi:mRNA interferase MazF
MTLRLYTLRAEVDFDGRSAGILLDQIRSVDKQRLLGKIGEIERLL